VWAVGQGNPEFLVEKSHFLFPFPGQKATISWKIPGIKRGFTVKLAVFVSRMKNNPQFYEKIKIRNFTVTWDVGKDLDLRFMLGHVPFP